MLNSYSSSFDSDQHVLDIAKRQQMSQCQLPKLMQTPSDLKPPTINSSFINQPSPFTDPVRSFISYRDSAQNNFDQSRKAKTLGIHSEGVEVKFLDEQQTKRMKKSLFNNTLRMERRQAPTDLLQTSSLSKELLEKKLVRKFANNLIQKAQVFRENLFNPYQKELLTEKYLESESHHLNTEELNQIHIKSLYFLIQDVCSVSFMTILFFWLPYKVSFKEQNDISFSIIILLTIIIDMMISFVKPYISEGKLIQSTNVIMHNYIYYQSIVDFVFLITSSIILLIEFSQLYLWIILLFQVITQICKLNQTLSRINDFLPFSYSYVKICINIMYAIHICACFWHYIGSQESESWLSNLDIEETNDYTKYCYSLYWSTQILLSVGQGDIPIKTNAELIYSAVIMFLSSWLLAFIISHVNHQYECNNSQTKNRQMEVVNSFLSRRKVSLEMSARIRNYLKFLSNSDRKEQEMQTIIQLLTPTLREELLVQMRIQALLACKPLSKFSRDTLEHLTQLMDYVTFSPNEMIIDKNTDDDHSLYIIDTGEVQIINQNKVLAKLTTKESFGEYSFFSDQQRKASAKATGFVQLYKVDKQKFVKLVQQNKSDHERFMFIQHSLIHSQFEAANLQCYSCKSSTHLISKCPFWTYQPDFEKVHKKENYNSQNRTLHIRTNETDRKKKNETFLRLIGNYDALKILRLKYDLIYDDDDDDDDRDDEEEDENLESYSELSNDDQSDEGYSDNRPNEKQQDGTIVSILKQQDQIKETSKILQEVDDENDQMFIIRPNTQKGTLSTAQFQHQNELQLQQFQQYQQLQQQQQQLYKFSLVPQDPKQVRRTSTPQEMQSSQLIANECSIPSVKKIKNTPQIVFKGETDSQQGGSKLRVNSNIRAPSYVDKVRKNLSRIREEDSDTLNLSNRQQSEDQASSPYPRQVGRQSHSSSQVRQSMKRFSSKLSTIPIKSGTITQLRSTISPHTRSNIHLPTAVGMVDLSMYKRVEPQAEEYDRMYSYTLYFPVDNYKNVINRLNYFLKWKLSKYIPSKYTFSCHVKRLADRFEEYMRVEINPDK